MIFIILHIVATLLALVTGSLAVVAGHYAFGAIFLVFAAYNAWVTYSEVIVHGGNMG